MSNTYATIVDKKLVGSNGVKLLRKANLALLESAVDAIEEELDSKVDGNVRIFLGNCMTAAATQAKTASIDGLTALQPGDIFVLLMSSGQTYNGAPTLNINNLGAASIRRLNGTNAAQYEWVAGQVIMLEYNGTHFVLIDGGQATTTYYGKTRLSSAVDSDSESLAATPKAVKLAYDAAMAAQSIEHRFFTGTIPTTGWTLTDGLYHVSVAMSGVLATDKAGNIGPVQTGSEATDKPMRKAWGKIVRAVAAANSITVYATSIPSVQIPILMEVTR